MYLISFVLLNLMYIFGCYLCARTYFYFMDFLRQSPKNVFIRNLMIYGLFIVFVIIEIPFAIFFPAWISEKMAIFERTSFTTGGLILFGFFVLVISALLGRKNSKRSLIKLG